MIDSPVQDLASTGMDDLQPPGWDVERTVPPAFRARKVDVEQSGSQRWLGFDAGSAMVAGPGGRTAFLRDLGTHTT